MLCTAPDGILPPGACGFRSGLLQWGQDVLGFRKEYVSVN